MIFSPTETPVSDGNDVIWLLREDVQRLFHEEDPTRAFGYGDFAITVASTRALTLEEGQCLGRDEQDFWAWSHQPQVSQ